MRRLNLGIVAHVDAGKTTLTERLLYAAGVIDAPGSVDAGTTQTDSLALERQRGITIRAAVVSFTIDDLTVNLLDTPGHPDFIAEVERVLGVLDGAVLLLSAVEGVQAQTRVLLRTLRRLGIPTLLFVNKIDRRGADAERVLTAIAERLTPAIIPMGAVRDLGTPDAAFTPCGAADASFRVELAEVLAEHDEALLAAYVADATVSYGLLRATLVTQTQQGLVHPVFFGSAITGAGVDALTAGIAELLPAAEGAADRPLSGAVFKVERGPGGEKIAYARLFSGTIRTRDRLQLGRDTGWETAREQDRQTGRETELAVTAIRVFERGTAVQRPSVSAGQIATLWGLGEVQVGDALGIPPTTVAGRQFAPPTLETVVVPRSPADQAALRVALGQLAEQDPLINLRQDDGRHELTISLYGEVQKEVIEDTLASDFGLQVAFRETTPIYIERPVGVGEDAEILRKAPDPSLATAPLSELNAHTNTQLLRKARNPFLAAVGLRIEPAPVNTGVQFHLAGEVLGTTPPAFIKAIEESVQETLRQGLHGWQVTDCTVTLTYSGHAPATAAGDFRTLTPLVVMRALSQSGTAVYEPVHRFQLEMPADALAVVLSLLVRLDALPQTPATRGSSCLLEGEIAAGRVYELQQQLGALTRGEGVLESAFAAYQPVRGPFPVRPRTDHNPLNRREYLLHVLRRV